MSGGWLRWLRTSISTTTRRDASLGGQVYWSKTDGTMQPITLAINLGPAAKKVARMGSPGEDGVYRFVGLHDRSICKAKTEKPL